MKRTLSSLAFVKILVFTCACTAAQPGEKKSDTDTGEACAETYVCRVQGKCARKNGVCIAASAQSCRNSVLCHTEGRCTAKDGKCIAASDEDCSRSTSCIHQKKCKAKNGICRLLTDNPSDCSGGSNSPCELYGECDVVGGKCAPSSDAHCRKAMICKVQARCSLQGEQCVVGSDADCHQSDYCMRFGVCAHKDGACVATNDADCTYSEGCWRRQECVARNDVCVVGRDVDCAFSPDCTEKGYCSAHEGNCVARVDADCLQSQDCRKNGRCWAENQKCVARTDADCLKSANCKTLGHCSAVSGGCRQVTDRDCEMQTSACAQEGRCSINNCGENCVPAVSCIPTDDEMCRRSKVCKEKGRCFAGEFSCERRSGDDCRNSDLCKETGLCDLSDGRCVVGHDEDCAASQSCAREGRCALLTTAAGHNFCAAGSNAHCRKSEVCREHGRCSVCREPSGYPFKYGDCVAASNRDCRRSVGCKKDGKCILAGKTCVAEDPDGWDEEHVRPKYNINCRRLQVCSVSGECTFDKKTVNCVAASSKDCQKSEHCRDWGHCTLDADSQKCVPGSDAECEQSRRCIEEKHHCKKYGDICGAESNAVCAATDDCKNRGMCTAENGRCIIGPDDCENSEVCRRLGRCTLQKGRCIAASDAECAESSVCRIDHRCRAAGNCTYFRPSLEQVIGDKKYRPFGPVGGFFYWEQMDGDRHPFKWPAMDILLTDQKLSTDTEGREDIEKHSGVLEFAADDFFFGVWARRRLIPEPRNAKGLLESWFSVDALVTVDATERKRIHQRSDEVAEFIRAVQELYPKTNFKPIVLGEYRGGMIALDLAVRYPSLVHAVVVVSAVLPKEMLPKQSSDQTSEKPLIRFVHIADSSTADVKEIQQVMDTYTAAQYDVALINRDDIPRGLDRVNLSEICFD